MNADVAFDKLIHKNALPIPVANPSAETRKGIGKTAARPAAVARASAPAATPESVFGKTAQVADLPDEEPGDYRPRGGTDTVSEDQVLYVTPTETDLDAVSGADEEIDNAFIHGARIVGRDASPPETFHETEDEYILRQAPTGYDEIDTGLDLARRARRFAYLPLEGMEEFENRSRDLMARLQSQMPDRPSLAVTGVMHGDGQAELALRLALAMAKRVDYRVLLADFNLRQPQIASRLGLSSKHFVLSDVLRGSCPLGEALILGEEDNLYVLPARASDRDGDEFFDDRQVQALMSQLHETFDFTIIACGPMDHADAAIVCRHAGHAALAAFCGVSRARPLREAAERLAEAGARVAGLVMTGA